METRINSVDGAEMCRVPAGVFKMGLSEPEIREYVSTRRTDPSSLKMMRPQRMVHLDEFWIYVRPITRAQFRRFVEANRKYEMPPDYHFLGPSEKLIMDDEYPVDSVNWFTAGAYCKWAKVELPTEAQWEKAARGVEGAFYPWGNEWDDSRANFDNRIGEKKAQPCRVDEYANGASPYGALQMAGNVKEWCQDRFAPYGYDEPPFKGVIGRLKFDHKPDLQDDPEVIRNPKGPSMGSSRVVRGGGWRNGNPDWAGLCTYRGAENPRNGYSDLGFRPVLVASDG
ncbi:MAG TPA: formylglycine-generating enzyme family protein [Fimbriimonas sp.]|nr:formylglycine-generating enzyme family protein [Fimbriimonas sp.]